jgi:lysine 2,3-aminomutase
MNKENKRPKIYADISDEKWNDWHWQMQNRIQDVDQFKKVFDIDSKTEDELRRCASTLRMAITPYIASLMDWDDPYCPIRRQFVPTALEVEYSEADMADPLAEDANSPAPGLTHRYPDRVLLLLTGECSNFCRHCTRRRLVVNKDRSFLSTFDKCVEYIKKHEEVRDIVISGGDPLTLSDERIEYVLKTLSAIDHVEILRLGTRMPVVCPMRVTDEFCEIIKKYHPVFVNIHVNHPKEITDEVAAACHKLASTGAPLGNQSVLLRGVNDSPHIIKALVHALLRIRVRPYYIYQCDLSLGIEHFRTSVGRGIEIIEALRGHTSGMAVPTFVVDAPGGGGKIPVMPNYVISRSRDTIILRNYEGMITPYKEPEYKVRDRGHAKPFNTEKYRAKRGPAYIYENPRTYLEPVIKKLK